MWEWTQLRGRRHSGGAKEERTRCQLLWEESGSGLDEGTDGVQGNQLSHDEVSQDADGDGFGLGASPVKRMKE